MGFWKALSRNAGVRRWSQIFPAAKIQPRFSARYLSSSPGRLLLLPQDRRRDEHHLFTHVRTFASSGGGGDDQFGEGEGDDDENDLDNDVADEEINLNHVVLPADQEEPCSKLLTSLFAHHPTTSPTRLVHEWIKDGNTLTEPIVVKVFRKLQSSKRAAQARRLMNVVIKEKLVELTERINLLAILSAQRTRKMAAATTLYSALPKDSRSPAICNAMVVGYAKDGDAANAEQILATFTPKTAQAYNSLIFMHLRLGSRKKAIETYERMRKAGVRPNKITLMTLMKNKSRLGIEVDKKEAEEILNEGIDDLRSNKMQLYAARNSILTYAYMGEAEQVERIWSELQQVEGLPTYFCSMAVEAFGVLKKIDKVEEIVNQLSEKQKREPAFYPALVRAYSKNDLVYKAEEVVKHVREGQKDQGTKLTYQIYDELIEAYLERGDGDNALEKIKEAREYVMNKRTGAGFQTVKKLLKICAAKKDVENAEELVKSTPSLCTEAYNELLKVYAAAEKKPEGNFVERMVKDRVKPDEKTRRLLAKMGKHDQVMW